MIPLSDDHPSARPAFKTVLIVAAIAAVRVIVEGAVCADDVCGRDGGRAVRGLGGCPGIPRRTAPGPSFREART